MLLLFSFAFAQIPDISLDTRTPLLETAAGTTVNVVLVVGNGSSSEQVVNLAAQLPQGWRSLFVLEPITLAPQSNSVVIVTVQIPEDAAAAAYLLTFAATRAGEDPVTAEVTVLLPEIRRLEFQPLTVPDVVIADDVVLEYRLTNSGNIARELVLDANSDPDYPVTVTPQEVVLEPNQSVPINITVNVPELTNNVALQVRLQVREDDEVVTGQVARVTLLPETLPSRSGFHVLPVTARLEQTLDNRQRLSSPEIALEGQGSLRDDDAGVLEFRLAAPLAPVPNAVRSNLARYDMFAAYETPSWRLALGRQTFQREVLLPLRGITTGISGGYTLAHITETDITETDTTETNTTETNTVNRVRDIAFDGYLLGEQGRAGRERFGVSVTGRDVRAPDAWVARATFLTPITDNPDVASAALAANVTTTRRFPVDVLGDVTFTGELGSAYDFAEEVAWQADVTLRTDNVTVNAAHLALPSGFRGERNGRVNTRVGGNGNFQVGVRWFVSGSWQASHITGENFGTNRSVNVSVRTIVAGLRPAVTYFAQHSQSDRFDGTLTRFRVDVSQPLHLPAGWGIDRTTLDHQLNWQRWRQGGRDDEVLEYTLDSRIVALGHTFGTELELALEPRLQLESLGLTWRGEMFGINGDVALEYLPRRGDFLALTGNVDVAVPWLAPGLADEGGLELRTRLSSDSKRIFGRVTLAYEVPLELPLGRSSSAGSLLVRLQTPTGEPLPNVVVTVAGLSLATDTNGEAFFPAIDGGSYQLDVRRADLRPGQLALPALPYTLTINPQEDQILSFTITDAGRVSGQIRLAEATGGTFVGGLDPEAEAGLIGGVLVQLRQGERATRKLSNLEGRFLFEGIAPGEYVLEVFPNLPEVYVLEPASIPVTVVPNETSQGTFTIERIQREIQFQDGGSLGGSLGGDDEDNDGDDGGGGITLGD